MSDVLNTLKKSKVIAIILGIEPQQADPLFEAESSLFPRMWIKE